MKNILAIICLSISGLTANAQSNFVSQKSYKLIAMEPYPVPKAIYTQQQYDAYDRSLHKDWVNSALLEYGADKQIRFAQHVGTETRSDKNAVWFFDNPTCATCIKTLQMQILSETPSQVIYVMEDEDQNPQFKIKLTFIKQ
jgi:hypothetical protein